MGDETFQRTVVVTGGAGFVGSNLLLHLVPAYPDCRWVNVDCLTYAGNLDSLAECLEDALHVFVQGDIGDGALVGQLLAEHHPQAIVNFAAESHVDRSIDGPAEFVQTNVVGTFRLLEAARQYWSGLPEAEAAVAAKVEFTLGTRTGVSG